MTTLFSFVEEYHFMKRFSAAIVLLIAGGLLLSAGCLSSASSGDSGQAASAGAGTTGPVTAVPAVTPPAGPVPAAALSPGDYATFNPAGTGEGKLTVVQYSMWDRYEWKNTFWGNHYFNATPKTGNRFMVLFVRLINPGTKPVLAPSPAYFIVHENGSAYRYTPTGDPTLIIKGTDEIQIDYAVEKIRPDRYLNPDPNNPIDGYIIYEVPQTFDPARGYVEVNLFGKKTVVWKFS